MASALESLRAAERAAQRASMRVDLDVASFARSWPYVTAAARAASQKVEFDDPSLTIQRIALIGDGHHEANQRHAWPGPGNLDDDCARIVRKLLDVAASRTELQGPEGKEAHRLIVSTLWVVSHVLARESRDHLSDLRYTHTHTSHGRSSTRIPRPVEWQRQAFVSDTIGRATTCEYLAESALHDHPTGIDVWAGDLSHAVAAWDLEVHRALLTLRSTSTLALVGRVEASMHAGLGAVLAKAAPDSAIAPDTADRLVPVLGRVGDAWEAMVQRVFELSWGSDPVPQSLLRSADNLRDQFQNATIPGSTAASRVVMIEAISSYLSSSLASSVAARELLHDGELRAPARAINAILLRELDANPRAFRQEGVAALVAPRDLHRGVAVPIPKVIRDLIAPELSNVCVESVEALRRSVRLETAHFPKKSIDAPASELPLAANHLPGLGITPQPLVPPLSR